MRELVYQALSSDPTLTVLVADRIYPSGSLGVGDIPAAPELPYLQYGWDSETAYTEVRETGGALRRMLRVWAYDYRGSYDRIDAIHKAVRDTVLGLAGQKDTTGKQCTDVLFVTLGGDLTDNVRNLNVKQASYRIVGQ